MSLLPRRQFLQALLALGTSAALGRGADVRLPPVRRITSGPKFHWFGYYDKLQFDPTGRYVLGCAVDFEHRSPRPDDVIRVGMVDLHDNDRWIDLGESRAWNWQQGCMLQFLPGSRTEVIWNDRDKDRFVAHILDIVTRKKRTLPAPIYTVSPDGTTALYPDFRRLNDCRPGYGYAGIADPARDLPTPKDAGIWKLNLATGATRLLVSFAGIAEVAYDGLSRPNGNDPKKSKHWFNHLLYNTDGSRFLWLHRWRELAADRQFVARGFSTRMFTANTDGKERYVVDPHGGTSHFIWRDPQHIAAWAWHPSLKQERFYLFTDRSDKVTPLAPDVMTVNGHNTYLPGFMGRWILNDTYPDRERKQHPYLYDTQTKTRHPLGHFDAPTEYAGEWRCDLHPRSSPDGTRVVIDSPHEGQGRQMYLIDIAGIVRPR